VCAAGLETIVGHFSFHRHQSVLETAAGPSQAQGVYLLGVETVLLGTFRSSGAKAGPKESICYRSWNCCWSLFVRLAPSICYRSWHCCWARFVPLGTRPGPRSLSVRGLETAVGHFSFDWAQGRAQGVYLLQVLKLLLGTFRSTGPKAGLKEPICYGSWNCCWALFVRLGPRPGPRSLSVTGLEAAVGRFSFHWAKGQAQGAYLLRVLKVHIRYSVIFRYAAMCLLWLFHVLSQLNPCPPLKGVGGTRALALLLKQIMWVTTPISTAHLARKQNLTGTHQLVHSSRISVQNEVQVPMEFPCSSNQTVKDDKTYINEYVPNPLLIACLYV